MDAKSLKSLSTTWSLSTKHYLVFLAIASTHCLQNEYHLFLREQILFKLFPTVTLNKKCLL